jgi:hypothetical protein
MLQEMQVSPQQLSDQLQTQYNIMVWIRKLSYCIDIGSLHNECGPLPADLGSHPQVHSEDYLPHQTTNELDRDDQAGNWQRQQRIGS